MTNRCFIPLQKSSKLVQPTKDDLYNITNWIACLWGASAWNVGHEAMLDTLTPT